MPIPSPWCPSGDSSGEMPNMHQNVLSKPSSRNRNGSLGVPGPSNRGGTGRPSYSQPQPPSPSAPGRCCCCGHEAETGGGSVSSMRASTSYATLQVADETPAPLLPAPPPPPLLLPEVPAAAIMGACSSSRRNVTMRPTLPVTCGWALRASRTCSRGIVCVRVGGGTKDG